MDKKSDKWKCVLEIARAHGVGQAALYKWGKRGVPKEWQIKIFEETAGAISFNDFDEFKKAVAV